MPLLVTRKCLRLPPLSNCTKAHRPKCLVTLDRTKPKNSLVHTFVKSEHETALGQKRLIHSVRERKSFSFGCDRKKKEITAPSVATIPAKACIEDPVFDTRISLCLNCEHVHLFHEGTTPGSWQRPPAKKKKGLVRLYGFE